MSCRRTAVVSALIAVFMGSSLSPAEAIPYQQPPRAIIDLVEAPPTPGYSLSPNDKRVLYTQHGGLLSIHELSQPELRLAGLTFNPRNSGPSRRRLIKSLQLQAFPDGVITPVKGLPADARIANLSWSPDSRQLAFSRVFSDRMELWCLDAASAQARRLMPLPLNGVGGTPFRWRSDSKHLVAHVLPLNRGPAPVALEAPTGPNVQESTGEKAAAQTQPFVLKTAHDERLFEYYLKSQLVSVDLTGQTTLLGKPDLHSQVEVSPDGNYLLVKTVHRPFSAMVQMNRFPFRIEVWDQKGRKVQEVADLPLAENIPVSFDAVRKGRREVTWRDDAASTLFWCEAQDEGDPKRQVGIHDALYTWKAPFKSEPRRLLDLAYRFSGINWGNGQLALVQEAWWSTRRTRTFRIQPDHHEAPRLVFDRSWEDRYGDPGSPIEILNANKRSVLLIAENGREIFLSGAGASPEGNRPFLDRFDLEASRSVRLWRCEPKRYETLLGILDRKGEKLLISRESPTQQPNYYYRAAKEQPFTAVTHFPNPMKGLVGIQKQLITYSRADGVKLSGTLYLPAGYKSEQGRLPVLMWAYPQEFKSADAAGQITGSPYRFDWVSPHSPLFWLTQGYAVLDNPKIPIIGQGSQEPNDTYVEQLVAGAKAAVDEVVRLGVADPKRLAVGGHSYGAFMTANLLAHTELFAAGIARSGAYNRTLTPFSFQAEERTLWQAPQTYITMSPFMHADKIKSPLLLIHGESDSNTGTFPIQSERFFQAIKGVGGKARLVMLPREEHGYQARESILHMLYEMNVWLDRHVKNRPEETK